jgi:hypothetical protein
VNDLLSLLLMILGGIGVATVIQVLINWSIDGAESPEAKHGPRS